MGFGFEQLDVYHKAIDRVRHIYVLTKGFPNEEMFGLTGQLRRASVSMVANISESSARSKREFGRFIDIARGSLFECVALLEIACKQRYIKEDEFAVLKKDLTDLSKMLSGLKRSIIH